MTDSTLYQVEDGWIELIDGTRFPFGAEPDTLVDLIEPEWIAHVLGRLCRYNGHTRRFYSVAEHTLAMAIWVDAQPWATAKDALTALHHDDAEAIIGDLPRPIKHTMPEFKALETRLDQAFAMRFSLHSPFPKWLKDADARILRDERAAVMRPSKNRWNTDDLHPLGVRFYPLLGRVPPIMSALWLGKHYELMARMTAEGLNPFNDDGE
jgi:hypothetical protein